MLADGYKKRFGDLLEYDVEEELSRFREYRQQLGPYVVDAVQFMASAQQAGKKILVEGANGESLMSSILLSWSMLIQRFSALMLDLDWGVYHRVFGKNSCPRPRN